MTRNCLCGAVAIALIASGRVHRAKRRALGGGVITAICFHKPNRRLFRRCIRWLLKQGYTFISADELVEICCHGRPVPKGAAWLSFDDGWREVVSDVMPIIRDYKIPATLFIPPGIIEGDGLFPWLHDPTHTGFSSYQTARFLAWVPEGTRESVTLNELRELASYPEVGIGSHTVRHRASSVCTAEEIHYEINESKRALESLTGRAVKCFAYPQGLWDGRERQFLTESGYKLAATTQSAFVTPESDPFLVPRFTLGDDITLPEAICGMVGVWRPVVDPLKASVKRTVEAVCCLGAPAKRKVLSAHPK